MAKRSTASSTAWNAAGSHSTARHGRMPATSVGGRSGGALAPEDLERLAMATYLVGEYAESMEISRRAFRESIRAGDIGRAARSAFWVAVEHLGRGEMAPAAGWLARAERLVGDGGRERVESGYLLVAAAVVQASRSSIRTRL